MTRNEATAGGILTVLALLVVAGWWMTPGKPGTAAGTVNPAPIPPQGDDTLAYRAVTASDNTGAVTALILGFMIGGAAMIGLFCFGPVPETRRRPRRSGAAVVLRCSREAIDCLARQTYSSIAPGAVLETVIRNSMLDLVFFNRSIIRSMA
ncbi:hypothetical protein KHQ06_00110 [Nocardia tengchongensis]|uniref:Uncharacterized protein n=1 Tax=Nocardia tengchongensis TaxID=2055889 RepID=A0ABX8CNX1_9NOCA|nr:hypothetical protein [Nocardia tengchongensis]QVI21649.1 hypothetical protein KHQ06_00110 [Nocardia tengchongensis]